MVLFIKKLHPEAVLPSFATDGAAGADVRACISKTIYVYPGETVLVPLGFAMALPQDSAALLMPRSGLGAKDGIVLGNLVGLIDHDYRGGVAAAIWNRNPNGMPFRINPGDRIAQMVIVPVLRMQMVEVDNLEDTARGVGGFWSTGRG